jgi:aromatic ring-opening dioxygenase LigB subunit
MPGLVAGAFVPHSTALLPEVSGSQPDRLAGTRFAFARLDARLADVGANTILLVSPHGPEGTDQIPIRFVPRVSGHLSRFGAPRVALDLPVDVALTRELVISGRAAGFRLLPSEDRGLDHGAIVPLWLLPRARAGKRFVFIGISDWPGERLKAFGRWLGGALRDRSVILLASGRLANREEIDRPEGDGIAISDQCGSRPLTILRGALAAAGLRPTLLSYEEAFDSGCAVALGA